MNEIKIKYDNGKESQIQLNPIFANNKAHVSGTYYSKYATVTIVYDRQHNKSSYEYDFWVSTKKASITMARKDTSVTVNPLLISKFVNAYDIAKMGRTQYNLYVANESKSFGGFVRENNDKFAKNDSLLKIAVKRNKILADKSMEFIKQNGNLYFSLWKFGKLVHGDFNPDSLGKIFRTVFSEEFRNSFEGQEIAKILRARHLGKGVKAPDFESVDVLKNKISLKNFQGKHLLLVFWASWCGPCVKEIPAIKEIQASYSTDKLEIIGITQDRDSTAFVNAVKKYEVNWIHIYGDKILEKAYNGDLAIPKVFLINAQGIIVYSRDEEEDFDLVYLRKLLAKRIGNI